MKITVAMLTALEKVKNQTATGSVAEDQAGAALAEAFAAAPLRTQAGWMASSLGRDVASVFRRK